MKNTNDFYVIFTSLSKEITNNTTEGEMFALFHDCESSTAQGVEFKRHNRMIMIDGYKLFNEDSSVPFEDFWNLLRHSTLFEDRTDDFPLLTWFNNLESKIQTELLESFVFFFNGLTGNKLVTTKDKGTINLLIHFGGDKDKRTYYPTYILDFFKDKLQSFTFTVTPLSNKGTGGVVSFGDLSKGGVSLPNLENQIKKRVGEHKELYETLDKVYSYTLQDAFDKLSGLTGIIPNGGKIANYDKNITSYKVTALEIILNGIPTKKPSFFDNVFDVANSKGDSEINIIYVNPNTFHKTTLSRDKSLYTINGNKEKNIESIFEGRPTIFIGFFDFQKKENEDDIKYWWDSRFRFFDSCIWFRYVSLSAPNQLEETLAIIQKYKKNGLYDLGTTNEFLEFQIRLFNNSYVERVGREGQHSGHVTPFSFHSELKMKINADKKLKELDGYAWNILIIDDHSTDNIPDSKLNKIKLNKMDIINNVLENYNSSQLSCPIKNNIKNNIKTITIEHDDVNVTFNFDYVSTIKEAIKKIEPYDKHYDLVLLDYLFEKDNNFEYGHDFIIELAELFEKKKWDKIWIMPISVYHNALIDNLRNALIPLYHKHLIISEGADPICTPELFRYKLFSFLELQKNEFVKTQKTRKTFTEILNDAPKKKDIKIWASNSFSEIVELGVNFKKLCKHSEKGSAFAKTALEKDFFNLKKEEDWHHIQNLFYLVAFGNKYQHPQIRKELLYFFKTTLDQKNKNNGNENPLFEKLNKILENKF